jgi:hypothetical protein
MHRTWHTQKEIAGAIAGIIIKKITIHDVDLLNLVMRVLLSQGAGGNFRHHRAVPARVIDKRKVRLTGPLARLPAITRNLYRA